MAGFVTPTVTLIGGRYFKSASRAAAFYGVSPMVISRALDAANPESHVARVLLTQHLETGDADCLAKAADLLNSVCDRNPLDAVADGISKAHEVSVAEIRGNFRGRKIVAARRAFVMRAHELDYTTRQLACYLNRDHSTILNLRGALARNKRSE